MKVSGSCRTNLDAYRIEKWPTVFARCPNKGESVQSASGKTLVICNVTHATTGDGEPFVYLYLDRTL